ncbi:hydroxymethylglutaryl-CoA reductase, degradative [Streptococcus massiliensis]|uniref:3-hydroxy-3-methylglutaryl coenzyme A reductase n=1 Tax=Streptococcus massiliensis TaxID=313439 RepID=A0A380L034_9STRE|nr:hydroxymethylglutaryl-CoA reductase, degradative [Streptococcus massiliensis]SUN77276.1 hydroxymethylglutaryl-CoA reductase, degradative [Streptococcus massiliensis]
MTSWTGFSKKTPQERLEKLLTEKVLSQERVQELRTGATLPVTTANQMAENVLGTFALPYAVVPDFYVNGKDYLVPFVTEEPSVVLAASFAAKIIKHSGGFTTLIHERLMIGQVALYGLADQVAAQELIKKAETELIELANQAYPSIVKRGGGARAVTTAIKEDFLIVYLSVDTQEAMGANMLNTMLEAISGRLEDLTGGECLMAILSNYATESLVTAKCQIPFRYLSRDRSEAGTIAKKMALASDLAQADPYRASTHNKGIFNGIDAVVLATGNDWRAIEAGAHAYAARDGQYRGLSTWAIDKEQNLLKGQLTLPMPIATKGGSIGLNPTVAASFDLLQEPTAKELASIIVAVGLAQNFAALKALVSTGIQAGHMKLQAKSLALLAGAKEEEVAPLVKHLTEAKIFNLENAQEILKKIRQDKK